MLGAECGDVSAHNPKDELDFYAKRECDIGLIGLAVMGQNLVLNMNDHGYQGGCVQPHCFESGRFPQ